MVCKRPSSGHSGTKCRALREQVTGTHCPYSRHWVPKVSDNFWALLASRRLRYYAWCFMTILWWFYDGLVIILWQFHDTSITFMILRWYFDDTFCKVIQKVSFLYIIIYQLFIPLLNPKDDTLRLFHKKNFSCVRINSTLNLKRIWYNTL